MIYYRLLNMELVIDIYIYIYVCMYQIVMDRSRVVIHCIYSSFRV